MMYGSSTGYCKYILFDEKYKNINSRLFTLENVLICTYALFLWMKGPSHSCCVGAVRRDGFGP